MKKAYRDGIDVQVAFRSNAKQIAAESDSLNPQAPTFVNEEKVAARSDSFAQQASDFSSVQKTHDLGYAMIKNMADAGLADTAKRLLRPVARMFYRALKPFVRPLAFRVRRYFIDGLHQDLQRTSGATLEDLQAIKEALRQDLQRTSGATLQ
ncbi:MAG: hypothetical protein ACRECD_14705, partial [Burkholderiaceae bacterium]